MNRSHHHLQHQQKSSSNNHNNNNNNNNNNITTINININANSNTNTNTNATKHQRYNRRRAFSNLRSSRLTTNNTIPPLQPTTATITTGATGTTLKPVRITNRTALKNTSESASTTSTSTSISTSTTTTTTTTTSSASSDYRVINSNTNINSIKTKQKVNKMPKIRDNVIRSNLYTLSSYPTLLRFGIEIGQPRCERPVTSSVFHSTSIVDCHPDDTRRYKNQVFEHFMTQYDVFLPTSLVYNAIYDAAYTTNNKTTDNNSSDMTAGIGIHPVTIRLNTRTLATVDVTMKAPDVLTFEEDQQQHGTQEREYLDGLYILINHILRNEQLRHLQFMSSTSSTTSNSSKLSLRSSSSSFIIDLNHSLKKLNSHHAHFSSHNHKHSKSSSSNSSSRNKKMIQQARVIQSQHRILISLPHKFRPSPSMMNLNSHLPHAQHSKKHHHTNRLKKSGTIGMGLGLGTRPPPPPPWMNGSNHHHGIGASHNTNGHRSFPYRLSALVRQVPSFYHHQFHHAHSHKRVNSSSSSSDAGGILSTDDDDGNTNGTSKVKAMNTIFEHELLSLNLNPITIRSKQLAPVRGIYPDDHRFNDDSHLKDKMLHHFFERPVNLRDGWVCLSDDNISSSLITQYIDGLKRVLHRHGLEKIENPIHHIVPLNTTLGFEISKEVMSTFEQVHRIRQLKEESCHLHVMLMVSSGDRGSSSRGDNTEEDVEEDAHKRQKYEEELKYLGDCELGIAICFVKLNDNLDTIAHKLNCYLGGFNIIMNCASLLDDAAYKQSPSWSSLINGLPFILPTIICAISVSTAVDDCNTLVACVGVDKWNGKRCCAAVAVHKHVDVSLGVLACMNEFMRNIERHRQAFGLCSENRMGLSLSDQGESIMILRDIPYEEEEERGGGGGGEEGEGDVRKREDLNSKKMNVDHHHNNNNKNDELNVGQKEIELLKHECECMKRMNMKLTYVTVCDSKHHQVQFIEDSSCSTTTSTNQDEQNTIEGHTNMNTNNKATRYMSHVTTPPTSFGDDDVEDDEEDKDEDKKSHTETRYTIPNEGDKDNNVELEEDPQQTVADGTVIDEDRNLIAHDNEFYLVSDSWYGKACKYNVLNDDFQLSHEQMMQFIYGLCIGQLHRTPLPIVACVHECRMMIRRISSYLNRRPYRETIHNGDIHIINIHRNLTSSAFYL